jgi:Glycosyltransferase family 87
VVLPARHARRAGPAVALAAVYGLAVGVGPTANVEVNDLFLYRSMTALVADGLVPYRDWEFEYPPLAIVPIALGGVLGLGERVYAVTFAVLMLGCLLALQALAGRLAGPRAAWACVPAPLLLGAMIRTHYDLLPAAMVAGALVLVARERTTWAFAVLGAGTATKLFPALLVPLLCGWLLGNRRRERILPGLAAFAAVVVVASAPFLSPGFADQATFHLERPVQIESTPAVVLSLLGDSHVTGTPARPDRFKSNGLAGGPAGLVAALCALMFAAAYAGVVVLARRGGDVRRLTLLGLAAVVAFVVFGKVLSPQFMIWLLPFAAAAWAWGDRAIAGLCAAAALLTQLEFPSRYFDLVAQEPAVVALVGARNAVLLVLLCVTVATVAGPARSRRRASAPGTG